jgi:hypothetical protein
MTARIWYPPDEATAASTMAVFVEWLRAAAAQPDPPRWMSVWGEATRAIDPGAVFRWEAEEPASFGMALAAFAGLDESAGMAGNRLRYTGPKEALVLWRGSARMAWSRDGLRAVCQAGTHQVVTRPDSLPAAVDAALREGTWDELIAETAFHLLHNNTRPDDRVLCQWDGVGAADTPGVAPCLHAGKVLGVLTVGATLILADATDDRLAAIAAKEGAKILRPPLSAPGAP